jgi:hypothetical protein
MPEVYIRGKCIRICSIQTDQITHWLTVFPFAYAFHHFEICNVHLVAKAHILKNNDYEEARVY